MGAGHGGALHVSIDSPVHALRARTKLLGLLAFVMVVVATPRGWIPAFGVYAVLLGAVVALSRVPPLLLGRRMIVEVPFVVFAVLMPFIATGPRTELLGLTLSTAGLWGAWALLVKGTLGVLASLTFAATTEPLHILAALEQLRVPAPLVQIMAFMIRYLDVVTDEMNRMKIARASRGFTAGSLRSWPVLARALGVLFMRSYARGERVHLAMLSRGHDSSRPV